jgi:hypothetical protein
MADDERIARLARQIGDEIRKEQHVLLTESEMLEFRRRGAMDLYAICADFTASLNQLLAPRVLEITPAEYGSEMFRGAGPNLIQLHAHGRIVQIAFQATREKYSTEKFLTPYILEGEVRAFNQEMLEKTRLRSQALFYCLEDAGHRWHYYEWLQGRTGVFGRDQLVELLERVV